MSQTRSSRPFYVEITIPVAFESPYHIGSGENDALRTDAPVLRLPDGRPFIPGSSLRGVLRSHMEREYAVMGCTKEGWEGLFGPERINREDHFRGRLRVCDLYPATQPADEIRDHVAIHPEWGAAEFGAKFDMEATLPADQGYELRLIYEGDGANDEEYRLFHEAVGFLQRGRVRLGAKSAWGFGRLICKKDESTKVRIFDRTNPGGLTGFLNRRMNPGAPAGNALPAPLAAPKTAEPQQLKPWAFLDLTVKVSCEGPVIIKAPIPPQPVVVTDLVATAQDPAKYSKAGEDEADMVFITRANDTKKYFPGSSLRGVFRAQAQRICQISSLLQNGRDAVDRLFGTVKKQGTEGGKTLLEVEDGELVSEDTPVYFDHVAIDRITNAAEDGAKFSASALVSPEFRIRLTVRFTEDDLPALALFGFVLRDLMEGRLWAGAGVGRGYGFIKTAAVETCLLDIPATLPFFTADANWTASPIHDGRKAWRKDNGVLFADLNSLWTLCESTLIHDGDQGGTR
jgi:CRISPR/Cas system CSM-associated protein Csm3 (group 7 of RAMP superfamily)